MQKKSLSFQFRKSAITAEQTNGCPWYHCSLRRPQWRPRRRAALSPLARLRECMVISSRIIAPTSIAIMSRNHVFGRGHAPFSHHSASLTPVDTSGPFPSLNPTRATFGPAGSSGLSSALYLWTSRDNRKGRHRLIVDPEAQPNTSSFSDQAHCSNPPATNRWRPVLRTIWRMVTHYPVWDISWLVAYIFTWGSVVWVLNGLFTFLPLAQPAWTFWGEALTGGGVTAFVGCCIFEIGSALLLLEAVNTNREGCFGWAVQQEYKQGQLFLLSVPDLTHCRHHHRCRDTLLGSSPAIVSAAEYTANGAYQKRTWSWCPS